MSQKLTAILAEDEDLIRQDLVAKIEACDPDFQIAGQAENGRQALALIEQYHPDVVFTDVRMPVMDGLELIRTVQQQYSKIKLVILSGYSDFSYLQQAIRCGVSAYLLKPLEQDDLHKALQDVKDQIRQEAFLHTPETISSSGFPSFPQDCTQYLTAVCLGNLLSAERRAEGSLMLSFWAQVLQRLPPDGGEWSVLNLGGNERLIQLRTVRPAAPDRAAALLQQRLEQAMPDTPIQVAYALEPVTADNIWRISRRLQNLLHRCVIPGRNGLWALERAENLQRSPNLEIVKMRMHDNLQSAAKAGDPAQARQELERIVQFMVRQEIPQRYMEQILRELVEICLPFGTAAEAQRIHAEILQCVQDCRHTGLLAEQLLEIFHSNFWTGTEPADLAKKLRVYLDQNFPLLKRLEDLTEVFHYSYSYLAKLFRTHTGITLTQYVQQKRLDMAQALLQTEEALNASQVAALCGFSDRRNFLRSFKAATGLSPGEFRAKYRAHGKERA